jgi:hypothetical protein
MHKQSVVVAAACCDHPEVVPPPPLPPAGVCPWVWWWRWTTPTPTCRPTRSSSSSSGTHWWHRPYREGRACSTAHAHSTKVGPAGQNRRCCCWHTCSRILVALLAGNTHVCRKRTLLQGPTSWLPAHPACILPTTVLSCLLPCRWFPVHPQAVLPWWRPHWLQCWLPQRAQDQGQPHGHAQRHDSRGGGLQGNWHGR